MASCRNYPFAKNGHFIDGVDEYFNLTWQSNVWLYMDYLPYNGDYGVRLDSLYPKDRHIFQLLGLKGRAVQVLFTAKPKNRLNYHLAVLRHRRKGFDYSHYEKFQGKDAYYYYRDFEHDFLVVRHVVIPSKDNRLTSMVYYVDKDKHMGDGFKMLNYLAEINAQELQLDEGFRNFWQITDCHEDKVDLTFKIRQELTKKEKIVYLQMYTLYENSRGISYAKILTRKDPDSLSLALCPNIYALEYRNGRDQLLHTDTLYLAE
ncbi:hypothetical protein GCM10017764_06130 [Sphingobacterium griseoflavum]|uniref:Uncharacterized protein n=2 Tax=Sphingobacterium griseoflavum TaxID=1474952 RepID=A0ABQ3HTT1_9SPHI|nr:hypothetical protein GCM10017764_06130 [Sphingobacterium griseoflavum]